MAEASSGKSNGDSDSDDENNEENNGEYEAVTLGNFERKVT